MDRRTSPPPTVMPAGRRAPAASWVMPLRLASGLVLVTFLTTHFVNHALGLLGLAAMEAGRAWFLALWRNLPGTAVLYAALLTHPALGLWALYRRRHLRMPAWEAWQLGLGLTIPVLLAPHVTGTRIAHGWFAVEDSYLRVLLTLWELRPLMGLRQAAVLVIAWTHAMIGLHMWLRLRPWYPRVVAWGFAAALLLPTLALLGFVEGGREVSRRAREPGFARGAMQTTGPRDPGAPVALARVQDAILAVYGAALLGTLAARTARAWRARRRGVVRIAYDDGRVVTVPVGPTLLEASRLAGISHASVCGGRGRCSTCRVRVSSGVEALPPPSPAERRVLDRVGALPGVRLACQLRPVRDVTITLLVPPAATASPRAALAGTATGNEQEVAVLFADLRGFTAIAQRKLPYDVVFLLNRYFEVVGEAIHRAGGIPNQFTGDGVMALFGVDTTAEEGSRRAVRAAVEMVEGVARLGQALAPELPAPLRIGVGIHAGPAVVGRMGYADTVSLTAVGDTVNVASRLESLTKDYDCEVVVSEALAARAGLDVSAFPRHEVTVRNRAAPVVIRVVARARDLPGSPPPAVS